MLGIAVRFGSRALRADLSLLGRLLACCVLLTTVTACGNWVDVVDAGQVGVTVDSSGQPVLVVMVCSRYRPVVDLTEGRKAPDPDDKPNVERGNWQARKALTGVHKLPLANPGAKWKTTKSPRPLESDRLFIAGAGTVEDDNAGLRQVDFRIDDLADLSPNQVYADGKIESLAKFGVQDCG